MPPPPPQPLPAQPQPLRPQPLPSSDLIVAENSCVQGGRLIRIQTCVDGWVCIVLAHYESQLHGGSYPVGPNGRIVKADGRPWLEDLLTPGVELLRLVLYQMARVDDFSNAVQAEYDTRTDEDSRRALLLEVYEALDAPLDERLRMLHPWLPPKPDSAQSAPFGERGRWEQQ